MSLIQRWLLISGPDIISAFKFLISPEIAHLRWHFNAIRPNLPVEKFFITDFMREGVIK